MAFQPGDTVYVRWRKHAPGTTVLLTSRLTGTVFPHWYAVDDNGREWQIPEISLSRRPIPES